MSLSFGGATWSIALEWAVGDAVIMAGIFVYAAQSAVRSNLVVDAVLGGLAGLGYFVLALFSLSHMAFPGNSKVTLAHFLNLFFLAVVPYYFGKQSEFVASRFGDKLPLSVRTRS
jgi:hypothetical protein